MPLVPLPLIALLTFMLAGCVHDAATRPETAGVIDPLYLPPPPGVVGGELQTLFVEPLTVSAEGELTASERERLRQALVRSLGLTVSDHTRFRITEDPAGADMRLGADLAAVRKGVVTARLTLRNARTGDILISAYETRATDSLSNLGEVSGDEPALDLLFRSWGESLRAGLLELQGPVLPGSGRPPTGSP